LSEAYSTTSWATEQLHQASCKLPKEALRPALQCVYERCWPRFAPLSLLALPAVLSEGLRTPPKTGPYIRQTALRAVRLRPISSSLAPSSWAARASSTSRWPGTVLDQPVLRRHARSAPRQHGHDRTQICTILSIERLQRAGPGSCGATGWSSLREAELSGTRRESPAGGRRGAGPRPSARAQPYGTPLGRRSGW